MTIIYRGYEIDPVIDTTGAGTWAVCAAQSADCFRCYKVASDEPALDAAPATLDEAKALVDAVYAKKLRRIGTYEAIIDYLLGVPKEDMVNEIDGYMEGTEEHALDTEHVTDPDAYIDETLAIVEKTLAEIIDELAAS